VTFLTRDATSDLSVVGSTFELWGKLVDEYRLADLHLGPGDVFVDVGAHIGTASIAVLLDNLDATAIAVEPIPENIEVMRANAEALGVADRLSIIAAAVGSGRNVSIGYDYQSDPTNAYIGNLAGHDARKVATVPIITLASLVKLAGGSIAAMKVDCEGGEWGLLRSRSTAKVRRIVGEWHNDREGPVTLARLLPDHHIEVVAQEGASGLFRACL
jgi:FkbM family methyltransferase